MKMFCWKSAAVQCMIVFDYTNSATYVGLCFCLMVVSCLFRLLLLAMLLPVRAYRQPTLHCVKVGHPLSYDVSNMHEKAYYR